MAEKLKGKRVKVKIILVDSKYPEKKLYSYHDACNLVVDEGR